MYYPGLILDFKDLKLSMFKKKMPSLACNAAVGFFFSV